MKPLVGDDVEIAVLSEKEHLGNLEQILPRRSELIRPAVANVDQALVIFACKDPEPNFQLLDRFLVMMEYQDIPVHICFNKEDLVTEQEKDQIRSVYTPAGYHFFFTNAQLLQGMEELKHVLEGRATTVARAFRRGKIFSDQRLAGGKCDGNRRGQ